MIIQSKTILSRQLRDTTQDCDYLIKSVHLPLPPLTFEEVPVSLKKLGASDNPPDFDPLSAMLSTDMVEQPYGLKRYLAASDLVGSSLLQFTDTLLLASMSIPEWAAARKQKCTTVDNQNEADNVTHLELRTTPAGFLRPYSFEVIAQPGYRLITYC